MEDEEDFDTGIEVITIILDPNEMAPRIDLGKVSPHVAINIFNKAVEALEASLPYPTITYDDVIIAIDMYNGEEFDDD
jgi:hypothetical protein